MYGMYYFLCQYLLRKNVAKCNTSFPFLHAKRFALCANLHTAAFFGKKKLRKNETRQQTVYTAAVPAYIHVGACVVTGEK